MRFHLAGAGAAGTALARALHAAGWSVGGVACRSTARARERRALIGAGEPVDMDGLAGDPRATEPELLLVAVPDRHIAAVAQALAQRPWAPDSTALHLSGSVEVDALAPLAEAGLCIGGLHPLKSFVDPVRDASSLAGIVMALEGDERAVAVAHRIASDLGAQPFRLLPGQRAAWHAAASHACNHLVALLDQALDLLEQAGLSRDEGRAALVPLLAGTVDNLARHAPGAALTGPVVRGDLPAVERHLAALSRQAPDLAAAYRALARRALDLALRERGLDPELGRRLGALLDDRD